ncbi:hypothetical protein [Pseudomonas sp. PWP3-1b2]|uniref:hypothetical protein n=1 Tax=Pseudomonas sp. PWP3-1b2 TaxID=2804656 RepID=UPI003CF3851F
MNTKPTMYATGVALAFINVPLGVGAFATGITNLSGEPYEHHGTLRHFMPVIFDAKQKSSVLWEPGCDTVAQPAACSELVNQSKGLPKRSSFLKRILDGGDHSMTGRYMPHCWMTLRRWQEAQALSRGLITPREYTVIDDALASIANQLRQKTSNVWTPGRLRSCS